MNVSRGDTERPSMPVHVQIEKHVPEGKGLGRLEDGRVALVDGVVPGDKIQIDEAKFSKNLVVVQQWTLLKGSLERVVPNCEVWDLCGGCDWIVVSPEQQRRSKRDLVKEALRRTGGLSEQSELTADCRQGEVEAYRSRVRLHIVDSKLGFYARGSHQLIEPRTCAVSRPALNAALEPLRAALIQNVQAASHFDSVELRECSEGRVSLNFTPRPSGKHRGRGRRQNKPVVDSTALLSAGAALKKSLGSSYLVATGEQDRNAERLWQKFSLPEGVSLFSAPGGFTQVHWPMNLAVVDELLRGLNGRKIETFLDLYAGAGNFTLPLLASGRSGMVVEGSRLSVAAARRGAKSLGAVEKVDIVEGDVGKTASELAKQSRKFDLVLVDPPRSGINAKLSDIVELCGDWLLVCSCNPVTLARDLRGLVDLGCRVESVQPFDLFPQTHHVEAVVWLKVGEGERARPVLS